MFLLCFLGGKITKPFFKAELMVMLLMHRTKTVNSYLYSCEATHGRSISRIRLIYISTAVQKCLHDIDPAQCTCTVEWTQSICKFRIRI